MKTSTAHKVQSATSLPLSPAADRHARMVKYVVMMSIRTVCFVLAIFVPGWGHLIFGIGAIVLPYIAVILANAGSTGSVELAQPVASSLSSLPELTVKNEAAQTNQEA